ncbi:MAG: DMT family transporter [Butyrivibrio sp.]|uniref:DMT family transporter n=1 Tax=Butyrivibrio sp. TaxID=28121 RepID=UPI0025F7BED9|nr:DMT family transporter [Butyrivibrio sp.]MCR5770200.1 DMT family transporter [Butyrivibrio sp.]
MAEQSNHNNSAPTGKELRLAVLHILLAALGFALMTFFVRISGDLPTMEKAFFRNFVALFIAVYTLFKKKVGFKIVQNAKSSMFLRCLFGTTGLIANFWAIDHLGIADANMLNKLSPFFAIIMSYFIMKEIPNKVDWLCVILAFTGALFIIKPGLGLSSFPALVGLYGGFGAGTAYAYVHKMGKLGQPGPTIVFYFSLFSCMLTLPFMIMQWEPMAPWQLGCLILSGISAAVGQFNITAAYQLAPAKSISVFDYTQVIFAAILGFLFLSEIPDVLSFVGYAVIIFAAVFKWEYNRKTSD